MKKPLSRQRLFQIRRNAEGKCGTCSNPKRDGCTQCDACMERQRVHARNKYRELAGIPFDAPVGKQGTKGYLKGVES